MRKVSKQSAVAIKDQGRKRAWDNGVSHGGTKGRQADTESKKTKHEERELQEGDTGMKKGLVSTLRSMKILSYWGRRY